MVDERKARDLEIARAIQNGSKEAFEELFRAYAERLCAFADQYVDSPEVSEEIVQDVYLSLWEDRGRWNPNANVRAYLYRTVRNKALDYLKHEEVVTRWKRETGLHDHAQSSSPGKDLRRRELNRSIQDALDELSDRQRAVVLLTRQHDMSYKEVASTLDISVKTVETHISRAFTHLRELLSHCTPLLTLLL